MERVNFALLADFVRARTNLVMLRKLPLASSVPQDGHPRRGARSAFLVRLESTVMSLELNAKIVKLGSTGSQVTQPLVAKNALLVTFKIQRDRRHVFHVRPGATI